jgi:hypothetical protein
MIVLAFALAGALWGVRAARKRNGERLDLLQYGAGYAIAFAILGAFVTIGIVRLVS